MLLRWYMNSRWNDLQNVTISHTFASFPIASFIFPQFFEEKSDPVVDIIVILEKYLATVYMRKTFHIDGLKEFKELFANISQSYLRTLVILAKYFVDHHEALVLSSPPSAHWLDKPNFYRLIDLCVHSIQLVGHAYNISELFMWIVHINFKSWMEKYQPLFTYQSYG